MDGQAASLQLEEYLPVQPLCVGVGSRLIDVFSVQRKLSLLPLHSVLDKVQPLGLELQLPMFSLQLLDASNSNTPIKWSAGRWTDSTVFPKKVPSLTSRCRAEEPRSSCCTCGNAEQQEPRCK